MSRFVINGGRPIRGKVRASGNKNAVLPMIAASLLTDQEVVLENVPDIRDVASMLAIAAHIGAEVSREGSTLRIRAAEICASTRCPGSCARRRERAFSSPLPCCTAWAARPCFRQAAI